LEHFLEPEKAQQAFDILDVDGDGQVTLHNIRDAVVTIYQVRKACFACKPDNTYFNACNVLAALCTTRHCLSVCVHPQDSLRTSYSKQAFALLHKLDHVSFFDMALGGGICNVAQFKLCQLLWDGIQGKLLQHCTNVTV